MHLAQVWQVARTEWKFSSVFCYCGGRISAEIACWVALDHQLSSAEIWLSENFSPNFSQTHECKFTTTICEAWGQIKYILLGQIQQIFVEPRHFFQSPVLNGFKSFHSASSAGFCKRVICEYFSLAPPPQVSLHSCEFNLRNEWEAQAHWTAGRRQGWQPQETESFWSRRRHTHGGKLSVPLSCVGAVCFVKHLRRESECVASVIMCSLLTSGILYACMFVWYVMYLCAMCSVRLQPSGVSVSCHPEAVAREESAAVWSHATSREPIRTPAKIRRRPQSCLLHVGAGFFLLHFTGLGSVYVMWCMH